MTGPAVRTSGIAAEIETLGSLDLAALRRRWRSLLGRPAPEHLPRSLLVRVLAYRLQNRAFGHLDRESARFLDRLALGAGRDADVPLPEVPSIKPGALLMREWQGTLQRITVLDDGFAWNGKSYRSLSEVARAITGTSWNGPRFFGLRDRHRASSGGGRAAVARNRAL